MQFRLFSSFVFSFECVVCLLFSRLAQKLSVLEDDRDKRKKEILTKRYQQYVNDEREKRKEMENKKTKIEREENYDFDLQQAIENSKKDNVKAAIDVESLDEEEQLKAAIEASLETSAVETNDTINNLVENDAEFAQVLAESMQDIQTADDQLSQPTQPDVLHDTPSSSSLSLSLSSSSSIDVPASASIAVESTFETSNSSSPAIQTNFPKPSYTTAPKLPAPFHANYKLQAVVQHKGKNSFSGLTEVEYRTALFQFINYRLFLVFRFVSR